MDDKEETIDVFKWSGNEQSESVKRNKRLLSTIDLEADRLADVQRDAEIYFDPSSRRFYEANGTPYRRGFLLYGPPGCGKTSLSVALASHVSVPLYIISLADIDDNELGKLFAKLPDRCVALLEDIDSAGVSQAATNEDDSNEERRTGPPKDQKAEEKPTPRAEKKVTLSGLLNAIDGACSAEGRLLIMTTNAPKSLDPALIRRGRIDKIIKMGYSNKETAEITFKRFFWQDPMNVFKEERIDRLAREFAKQMPKRSRITPAEVAGFCMNHRGNPSQAVA
ncbi:P-loop containing nucleoside triphosphate hydrolase protein, partial [Amniculicola lignicola CBS 123094]